jgi:hypothetical protein
MMITGLAQSKWIIFCLTRKYDPEIGVASQKLNPTVYFLYQGRDTPQDQIFRDVKDFPACFPDYKGRFVDFYI